MPFATNLLGIPLAMIASMVLGFMWYSVGMFGRPWMKLMGYTAAELQSEQKKMGPLYGVTALAGLGQAFVLAIMIYATGTVSLVSHLLLAVWLWLGFIMPTQLTGVIFGRRSLPLFLIDTGYQLVSILVMATVLFFL